MCVWGKTISVTTITKQFVFKQFDLPNEAWYPTQSCFRPLEMCKTYRESLKRNLCCKKKNMSSLFQPVVPIFAALQTKEQALMPTLVLEIQTETWGTRLCLCSLLGSIIPFGSTVSNRRKTDPSVRQILWRLCCFQSWYDHLKRPEHHWILTKFHTIKNARLFCWWKSQPSTFENWQSI